MRQLAKILCIACLGLGVAARSVAPHQALAAEAKADQGNRLAREAGEQFEAGNYAEAAKLFVQAWEAIARADPRPLRNAARALETGGLLAEALQRWEQVVRLPDMGPLDTKAAALMRKEAYVRSHELRQLLARAKAAEADVAYDAKRFRPAGDLYVRAHAISEPKAPNYLRFAAKAYQEGGLDKDAILAWQNYAKAEDVGSIGKKEAARQLEQLESQQEAVANASAGQKLYAAGRFAEAGEAFVAAFDGGSDKSSEQLRLAALAFERTLAKDRAAELWRRYRAVPDLTELSQEEADEHIRDLELAKARQEALALEAAKRWSEAGDKWLAVFTVGLQRDAEPFEKAAIAYENAAKVAGVGDRAKAYGKARSMWLRVATAPQVRERDQDRAAKRAAELTAAIEKGGKAAPAAIGVREEAPAATCTGCWTLATAGGVAMVAGVMAWVSSQTGAADLEQKLAQTDVNGKINGTAYFDASAAKTIIDRDRNMGTALFAVGSAAVLSGVIWGLVRGPGSAENPSRGGQIGVVGAPQGAVLTWSGRF